MKRALLAVLLAAAGAHANETPTVVGLHLITKHANAARYEGGRWNEQNWGVYARWASGFTAGAFRNSVERTTGYAGWTFSDSRDLAAVTLGLAYGYDRVVASGGDHEGIRCDGGCRVVRLQTVMVPILVPSVRLPLYRNASLRAAVLKSPGAPAGLHLSVEVKLP
jgi:hypothetical protein